MASLAVTSATPTAVASTASPGGLAVDKAACESKLADWVYCVSAKTPEGQAKIRDLTTQLQRIDAKIEKAGEAKATAASAVKAEAAGDAPPASNPTDTLGNLVDLYA